MVDVLTKKKRLSVDPTSVPTEEAPSVQAYLEPNDSVWQFASKV